MKKKKKKQRRLVPATIKRSFDSAGITRLTADWTTTSETIDSVLRRQIVTLRARARDMALNNDYAIKFLSMLKSNVLGKRGIQLKNKAAEIPFGKGQAVLDERANRLIQDAWKEWGKAENCTVSKDLTWKEVQELALESTATDGELFIRKVTPFDNEFNFAIELIDADLCDHELNEQLSNGDVVRLGVQRNAWKQRVAYHMLTENPNETAFVQSHGRRIEPVQAKDIAHIFLNRKLRQTRGYPWLAVSMDHANMLDGYEEAELVASRVAAAKMGFIKTTGDVEYQGDDDGAGNKYMEAQAGAFEQLQPGMDVTTFDPQHPGGNFGNFVKACLRRIAAGLGVSYNSLANDWESVNFSSGRLGLQGERDLWCDLQEWLSGKLHKPVFEEWLSIGLVNGNLPLPISKFKKFNMPQWNGRRWPWVDPTKEVSAKILELNAGLTSHSRILSELGIDEDELLDEVASFKEKAAARGLVFSEVNNDAAAMAAAEAPVIDENP